MRLIILYIFRLLCAHTCVCALIYLNLYELINISSGMSIRSLVCSPFVRIVGSSAEFALA